MYREYSREKLSKFPLANCAKACEPGFLRSEVCDRLSDDELKDLVVRTLQPGAFEDPDAPKPGIAASMERLGAAGVAAHERREMEAKMASGGAACPRCDFGLDSSTCVEG